MKRIPVTDLAHIYAHIAPLWEQFRDKSVFITGATGFFGKWLLETFAYADERLQLNLKITALSRNPEAFLEQYPFYRQLPFISFIKGDIVDFEFPQGEYQYIIHGATDADAKMIREQPLQMLDTITVGTRRVLEFARKLPLQSFLFLSSGAVYGNQDVDVPNNTEDSACVLNVNDTGSAYAEGKRLAELYCAVYNRFYGVPVKIARCYAFVGPHLPLQKHFAIGNFIDDALNNRDIIIKSDGTPARSYLYAADLVIWLLTIMLNGEANTAYNVGSDVGLSMAEIAAAVKQHNNSINVQILAPLGSSKKDRYVPAVNKAAQQLGLKVLINVDDAIKRTIDFYRD